MIIETGYIILDLRETW